MQIFWEFSVGYENDNLMTIPLWSIHRKNNFGMLNLWTNKPLTISRDKWVTRFTGTKLSQLQMGTSLIKLYLPKIPSNTLGKSMKFLCSGLSKFYDHFPKYYISLVRKVHFDFQYIIFDPTRTKCWDLCRPWVP